MRRRDPSFDYEAAFADAELVLRAIVPELDGIPVYIVDAARAGHVLTSGDVYGWWAPFLDMHLMDLVGERWCGRGIGMIINPDYFDLPADVPVEQHGVEVLATVLHEAAHALEIAVPMIRRRQMPDEPSIGLEFNRGILNALAGRVESEPAAVFRHCNDHHPRRFGRIVSHLAWRAAAIAGRRISPARIWDPGVGLAPRLFLQALGDEPERLQAVEFEIILNLPAPPAYRELCLRYDAAVTARLAAAAVFFPQEQPTMSLIQNLQQQEAEEAREAQEAYGQLVRDTLADRKRDPKEARAILKAAGKTTDDLAAFVNTRNMRRYCLRELRKIDEAREKLQSMDAELKERFEEFQRQRAAYDEYRKGCEAARRPLEDLLKQKDRIESQLRDCRPDLGAKLQELNREAWKVGQRVGQIRSEWLVNARSRVRECERAVRQSGWPEARAQAEQELARAQQRVRDLEAEAESLDQRLAELQDRQRAIEAEFFVDA